MTMYERLIQKLEIESFEDRKILNKIFCIMELDVNFPEPNRARRSGKTTLFNISLIFNIAIGKIDVVKYKKDSEEEKLNLKKTAFVFHHNREWTKCNKKLVTNVLKELGLNIEDKYNEIKVIK